MQDTRSITRRQFTIGLAAGAAILAMPGHATRVLAQQTDLASLGLPTIDVTVTATGYEGVPATLAAGRYLVNVTIPEELGFGGVGFLSPFGMSATDFIAAFASGGGEEASPEAVAVEASPAAEEEGPLPAFVYKSHFAGGPFGPAGVASAVVDLPAGEWVAWGDDPSAPHAPVAFTVTGDFPEVTDPDADITVSLLDFEVWVEGNLTAGDHTFKIENLGAQPHFMVLLKVPDGTTNEMVGDLLMSEVTGEAPPEGINPETDLQEVGLSATQSIDTAQWSNYSLETGTYTALCFFPRAGVGDPHAYHGMHTVFTVS